MLDDAIWKKLRAMVNEGSSIGQRMAIEDDTPQALKDIAKKLREQSVILPENQADYVPPGGRLEDEDDEEI